MAQAGRDWADFTPSEREVILNRQRQELPLGFTCWNCQRPVRRDAYLCEECERAEAERWNYEGSGSQVIAAHGMETPVDARQGGVLRHYSAEGHRERSERAKARGISEAQRAAMLAGMRKRKEQRGKE